jgi:hypothetical protein
MTWYCQNDRLSRFSLPYRIGLKYVGQWKNVNSCSGSDLERSDKNLGVGGGRVGSQCAGSDSDRIGIGLSIASLARTSP